MAFKRGIFSMLAMVLASGAAWATPAGHAEDKQIGFMAPATELMERLIDFHDLLLIIITAITLFVFALLAWVMIRYRAGANPEPSKTSHNLAVEIVWTVVPIIILVVIAVPSFRLLYFQEETPEADIVVEATGYQWRWSYRYPDHDGIEFTSNMLSLDLFGDGADPGDVASARQELGTFLNTGGEPEIYRTLDTDTRLVVPVGKVVKLLVTASDVLHSWTVPAFGIKMDAVPGRFNETWFRADKVGTYYGQCSELCGKDHSYMPIAVEVVTEEQFAAWLDYARAEYASIERSPATQLASGETAQ